MPIDTRTRWRAMAAAALPVVATRVAADTVNKTIGPDGRVIYSDRPSPQAKAQATLEYRNLPASPLPESALRFRAQLESRARDRGRAAQMVRDATPQLFTASWCGYCTQARDDLVARRIRLVEHDIETDGGMFAFIEAGGAKGVPLLLVGERRVPGYSRGGYDRVLGPH